jgi:hypothetical protein
MFSYFSQFVILFLCPTDHQQSKIFYNIRFILDFSHLLVLHPKKLNFLLMIFTC